MDSGRVHGKGWLCKGVLMPSPTTQSEGRVTMSANCPNHVLFEEDCADCQSNLVEIKEEEIARLRAENERLFKACQEAEVSERDAVEKLQACYDADNQLVRDNTALRKEVERLEERWLDEHNRLLRYVSQIAALKKAGDAMSDWIGTTERDYLRVQKEWFKAKKGEGE